MRRAGKNGFTLIELLVVISIISVLSGVILSAVGSARQRANDVRRLQDLREIQKAIQMYFSDNGSYPAQANTCTGDWPAAFKVALSLYLSPLPIDPRNSIASCSGSFHNYYGFANPVGADWGWGVCSTSVPTRIALFNLGDTTSRTLTNECGGGLTNSIIVQ